VGTVPTQAAARCGKRRVRLTLDQLELIRIVGTQPARDAAENCIDVLGRFSEALAEWSRAMPDSDVDKFVRELVRQP
jgi:hypothetical protein